jgi:hypothetical protein
MTDHDPIDLLVADLRTDVPEMSDEAVAAGRARLRKFIEPIPVTTEPQPDAAVVPLPKRRLLRSPPRRLIASAAAAVVLAAGVLFVQAARSDSPVPVASAAATLNSAADNINPVDEPIAPGQYRYFVAHSWNLLSGGTMPTDADPRSHPLAYQQEWKTENWVPADPAQLCTYRTHLGGRRWVVGSEEQAKEAGQELPPPSTKEESKPCDDGEDWSTQPSAEFLAALPRDPGRLYDLLRNMPMPVAISEEEWVMKRITDTLISGRAPADLRAALYRALALMPGLQVTEQVANLDGWQGTALGLSKYGVRYDLIIDPNTGQFIGERTVFEDNKHSVPPGTAFSYKSVSNPVVVDRVGATS